MKRSTLTLLCLAAAALAACDRQPVVMPPAPTVAMPGPAGPAGATGATGSTGEPGATGVPGSGTTVIVVPPAASAASS